ncbi:hypothetical protein CR513_41222, partial [Mucuna pruriens]
MTIGAHLEEYNFYSVGSTGRSRVLIMSREEGEQDVDIKLFIKAFQEQFKAVNANSYVGRYEVYHEKEISTKSFHRDLH